MEPTARKSLMIVALAFEGGMGLLAIMLGWLCDQPAWADLHASAGDALVGCLVSLPMLAGFVACLVLPFGPFQRLRLVGEEMIRPLFARATVLDLAWIALLAGVSEELFFRGFLQALLCRWLGVWLGVAAASVVFGLLHFITPTYAILAVLVGAYLGIVWLLTGNLLVVMVAHGLYDLVALVYLLRLANPTTSTALADSP